MRTTLAALAFLLTACIPATKTAPAPLRPQESAAVAPLANQARAEAQATREAAVKLEADVGAIHRTTSDLRAGINQATAEAARLRKQKTATEKELNDLWVILTAEQARTSELWQQVETSKASADQHREQRLRAEKRLEELVIAAAAADTEIKALRANHDAMTAQIEQARKTEAALQVKLGKAENQAAVARFLKASAAIAITILVVGFIALTALKIRPI